MSMMEVPWAQDQQIVRVNTCGSYGNGLLDAEIKVLLEFILHGNLHVRKQIDGGFLLLAKSMTGRSGSYESECEKAFIACPRRTITKSC